MLPRRNRNDEGAFDVAAVTEVYWMRFFASLRMTALAAPPSRFWKGGVFFRRIFAA
jgi:hypothetical protein